MSDENINSVGNQKRKRVVIFEDSSSDDSSDEFPKPTRRRKVAISSDSDSSVERSRRKRVVRVASDSSDSSDSDIVVKKPKSSKLQSASDSNDSSEWETENEGPDSQQTSSKDIKVKSDESSDSSNDDQAEKCPICLLRFKSQEVGSPESCDHNFCAECIREWSKSVNTCPVDRKKFNIILVRSSYEGQYLRSIQIDDATNNNFNNDISEDDYDYTPCEICGLSLDEDRLLLCDGCDLPYHLDCLDPPLTEVPEGEWYCAVCRDYPNVVADMEEFEYLLTRLSANIARRVPRLIPRTRQSERIRTRIVHQRRQNNDVSSDGNSTDHSETIETRQSGSNTTRPTKKTTKCRSTKRKKGKKRKSYKPKYKVTYEIDDQTGEKIAVKKKVRKYRRKTRKTKKRKVRSTVRRNVVPKTVKNRLARQLGIQPPKKAGQSLPDMKKVHINPDDINTRRYRAGIPALHLFGQRDQLDYFSESDNEYEASSSVNVRVARRPNMSDASLARLNARRKAIILGNEPSTSSAVDILGSIMDTQAKFHSKNSILSVTNDGTIKIDVKKKASNPLNDNGASRIRQTPMYSNNTSSSGGNGGYSNSNQYSSDRNYYRHYENSMPTSTVGYSEGNGNNYNRENQENDGPQDFSLNRACGSYEPTEDSPEKKNESYEGDRKTPLTNSDSELDIYSDIEAVTTSRFEENEIRCPSPPLISDFSNNPNFIEDEDNGSETDLIIDTEKPDSDKYDPATVFESDEEDNKEEDDAVTSTSKPITVLKQSNLDFDIAEDSHSETFQSANEPSTTLLPYDVDELEEPEDDCPNFSIYSSESMNLAKNTELSMFAPSDEVSDKPEDNESRNVTETEPYDLPSPIALRNSSTLYSDSEDESFMKVNPQKPFGIGDIQSMTEDISEEERSYTPCLDEKDQPAKEGLEGLDTEMISDDEKNDFEETPDVEDEPPTQQQTVSESDDLEINAKESELDFTKPDDSEDAEITDKNKSHDLEEDMGDLEDTIQSPLSTIDLNGDQDSSSIFKKLSRNNKSRNYRDKEKTKPVDQQFSLENKKDRKEKRKDKRTEIALYDVRSVIESRPKRDKFGRDPTIRKKSSPSLKSLTPPGPFDTDDIHISPSRLSRSTTPVMMREEDRIRSVSVSSRSRTPPIRQSFSRDDKSPSPVNTRNILRIRSGSKSRGRKRSRSRQRKRRPSKGRQQYENTKTSRRRKSGKEMSRSRSPTSYRRRPWERRRSRGWTPSLSRSRSPGFRNVTPSWTPPRAMNPSSRPENLTVSLPNYRKKKKDKRKKSDRRQRGETSSKRRRTRSARPAKEVFTSGNNILVSVSFNKENEQRSKRMRSGDRQPAARRVTRENGSHSTSKAAKKRRPRLVTNIKPIAIIDLERSPFRVITPPNDVIVLSDSENGDNNDMMVLPSSLNREAPHAASPELATNTSYVNSTGPKTPPEPQVKFTFSSKQTQLRAITNPLLEPDDVEEEIDPQEELENRLNEVMHKGPNTPPEPPNSPPSSPDAYDPFEPTKSRSQSPEPAHHSQSTVSQTVDISHEEVNESITIIDLSDKNVTPVHITPPLNASNLQPADSQSGVNVTASDASCVASPERTIGVIINQIIQAPVITKTVSAPTFPAASTSMVTSTPIAASIAIPRINILNSTIIPQSVVTSSIPQRIVLPNTTKSSPVNKVSPSKTPVKLTPIKPMPTKNIVKLPLTVVKGTAWKTQKKVPDVSLDFESPYSPGSNDYDDLFDPPPDNGRATKAPPVRNSKTQNSFDTLFGSSPGYIKNKNKKKAPRKSQRPSKNTKLVGVKLDEDNLKILDDLPNSAVELQVKDKFLKKLNRQERVVEEVKFVLKPYYTKKRVNKEEYKEVLRRAVPKICHNKSGEINPKKIQQLVVAYVRKLKHNKKVTSSSNPHTQNAHTQGSHPQKTEAVSNWLSKLN